MGIMDCVFCKIIRREIPSIIIKENENILVIKDLHPKAPIHYLVMPKKHIHNINDITPEDSEVFMDMLRMIKELSIELEEPKAFNIISNNGAAAGQTVFHMHWHFLSGTNIFKGNF